MLNNKTKKIWDSLYLFGSLAGAPLIALNISLGVWGYVLFLISSISSIILLKSSNASKSLMIVAVYFTIVNAIGIIRYV